MLPIIVIRVFDISVLNLSKDGVQAEMLRNEAEMLQTEIAEVISKVDRLFASTMSVDVFKILSDLDGKTFEKTTRSKKLEQQLLYLENIGYIEIKDMDILKEFIELNDIDVTQEGKDFLELRKRLRIK